MSELVELPSQPWVPYAKRDTAYWIFHELYQCRIPYIQMLSIDDIEQFGIPMSGDQYHDFGTANELRQVMIPISKMAEYFDKGVQISVIQYSDTKKIYERITDHLNAWKTKLSRSLNIGEAPVDDLKLLDRFANVVYDHAKYQFTDDTINSLLSRRVDVRNQDLNRMLNALENPKPKVERDKQEQEEKYPQRESMSRYFQPYRDVRVTPVVRNSGKGLNNSGASSRPSLGDFIGGKPIYDK